jgi:arsenical pump membrane protein
MSQRQVDKPVGPDITALIVFATIVAVLVRPRGISEGTAALAGAILLIVTGGLPLSEIPDVVRSIHGVLLFLVGLFWLTLAADRSGVFDRMARLSVRSARGDARRLLMAVFAFGTLTTAVLSNDATVVLVTPVVLRACRRLGLPPLPYLFACTFVADTASSLLPVSNPINLLYAEQLNISFTRHVVMLALPTVVAVAVNAGIFHLLFRRELPHRFEASRILGEPFPELSVVDRTVVVGLLLIGAAYVMAAVAGIEPYWVTLAGGVCLAIITVLGGRVSVRELVRVQPPSLYAFVVGLAVLVAAADNAGLLRLLGNAVLRAQHTGGLGGLAGITFGTALGTNIVNNWTMALAIVRPLEQVGGDSVLTFGSLFGADIGPNLSVVGSLATLIWLNEVRRGGLAVSSWTYLRLGVIATVPAVLAGTAVLFLISTFV